MTYSLQRLVNNCCTLTMQGRTHTVHPFAEGPRWQSFPLLSTINHSAEGDFIETSAKAFHLRLIKGNVFGLIFMLS